MPASRRSSLANTTSPQSLSQWRETAAVIVSNRTPTDAAALASLGDALSSNCWRDAAHVWSVFFIYFLTSNLVFGFLKATVLIICSYLLAPQMSPISGNGRLSLVGGSDPMDSPCFHRDLEGVLLTEIVEYAYSLVPTVKGQETYCGLPHLQAYRLLHASALADLGMLSEAQRFVFCFDRCSWWEVGC
jgi:hypothetical protein